MAFVYCDDRWKQQKQNSNPGPGEYVIELAPENCSNTSSGMIRPFKKWNTELKKSDRNDHNSFKQLVNKKMIRQWCMDEKRQTFRKGKLYKNNTMEVRPKQLTVEKDIQEYNCKFIIKNTNHSQANLQAKNKWGNMRIKEMLNVHRLNQKKKNMLKKQSSNKHYNSQTMMLQNRQKFHEELKQLQTVFNTNRKGSNKNIKIFNKNRDTKTQTKYLYHNKTQNHLRLSENTNDQLLVEPAGVYKTQTDTPFESRPETAYYVSNTCSIRQSHIISKEETLQTGLDEDSFEDSMEYIDDATPGPGAYQIKRQIAKQKPMTHIQKFGVTMQRFKTPKQKIVECQTFINPKVPQFKKQSIARQQFVGFGRTTKEEREQNGQMVDKFYEQYRSIQCKSKKLKKSSKSKFGFQSCKDRFAAQKGKEQSSSDESNKYEDDESVEYYEEMQKPSSAFLSKVTRQLNVNSVTEDVDFNGQNYNCLANKIKKQKQHLQDYQLVPPPFMTKSKRFQYSKIKKEQKEEQLKLIKRDQLRKKKQTKKKSFQKGYSFIKQKRGDVFTPNKENSPSPDKYNPSPKWIKDSHNLRFQTFDRK